MGLISKILSFTRVVRNGVNVSDVKADPGGGPNVTMDHFAPVGDDSFPLHTDYVVSVGVPGSGRQAAVGYVDPLNTPKALEGEKRIYARDSSGAAVAEVWLHNDKTVSISNASGSFTLGADGTIAGTNGGGVFTLQAGGDFVVNGAVISAAGEITNAAGKTLGTHTHPQGSDSAGDTQQDTEAPL